AKKTAAFSGTAGPSAARRPRAVVAPARPAHRRPAPRAGRPSVPVPWPPTDPAVPRGVALPLGAHEGILSFRAHARHGQDVHSTGSTSGTDSVAIAGVAGMLISDEARGQRLGVALMGAGSAVEARPRRRCVRLSLCGAGI